MEVRRGEIYLVNFGDSECVGREQAKNIRPAIVISNNIANSNPRNDIIAVALISSVVGKMNITHLSIPEGTTALHKPSKIMTEHIRSIDKSRLQGYKGKLVSNKLTELDNKLQLSLGIFDFV